MRGQQTIREVSSDASQLTALRHTGICRLPIYAADPREKIRRVPYICIQNDGSRVLGKDHCFDQNGQPLEPCIYLQLYKSIQIKYIYNSVDIYVYI